MRSIEGPAEEFCAELFPVLARAMTVFTGDAGLADEIAQETCLRVWQRWDEVATTRSPQAWAYRVARNLAVSRFRRAALARRASARLGRAPFVPAVDADILAVRAAVAALAPRQREALALRYFADLSVEDTAAAMRCAPGTVKALTSQAIAALRVQLANDDIDERTEVVPRDR